jgi:3-oxoacyl-(acyl-carrier-protein) synthase
MLRRVAITGMGIVSCLGVTVEAVTESLRLGKSGIVFDPERSALGFHSPLTGAIPDFSPTHPLTRKQRKTMPLFAQWAAEAAFQAVRHANLPEEMVQSEETGLVFGCDSSAKAAIEQATLLLEHKSTTSLGSGLVFQSMTSCVTMNLNTLLGIKGACWTISAACASGGHAVGQAADLIMLGRQERVICGAAQEINWQSMCSFDGLGAFSANPMPHKACRPFDRERDGLVPSGGAAALVLEDYEIALKRGATILGEVIGYGFSSDGESLSAPSKTGMARAMRMALKNARLAPTDIEYLCAHATSTPIGDAKETANILDVFGPMQVPVSSLKSMTGHELWMSGASQVVYTTLMAQHEFLAPNINFCGPDEDTAGLDIITTTRNTRISKAMCNAAGFGGTNSSLVLAF